MTKKFKYAVWKEGSHFVAQCLNVDVSSFGDTRKEALANIQEAVELYLEDNDEPEIADVKYAKVVSGPVKHA